MTVVALFVVPLVALGLTGIAAYSAFLSSRAARQVAGRDSDRRHDERTPRWVFTVAYEEESRSFRLQGRLTSAEAVETVRVSITEGYAVSFGNGQDGVATGQAFPMIAAAGPIAGGAPATWRIIVGSGPNRVLRMTVRSTRENEPAWETPETAEVTGDEVQIW